MKLNRILFATIAGAIAFASCTEVKNEITTSEFDPNKTPVTSLSYIEDESSDTKAVFEINATAAVKAGATSFTIFLAKSMDDDVLGNGAFFKNIAVESEEPFKVTLSSITGTDGEKISLVKGDLFIPMIRANYPPFIHSSWTKVFIPGSDRLALEVGYGLKPVVFGPSAGVSATATDEAITVTWRRVPYAEAYVLEYKKDSESEWKVIDGISADNNSYVIEGLDYETSYSYRVKAVKGSDVTDYTADVIKTDKTFKLRTKDQVIEFFATRAAEAGEKDEFKIMNDIDFEGASVSSVASYAGILDGQGFALKNLKIETSLFGTLEGTIKNIIIEGTATASGSFAAIVDTNNGTIDNVTSRVSITDACPKDATAGVAIGGIAKISTGKIINCVNEGNVTVTCDGVLASPAVGGVVSYQKGGTFTGNKNVGAVLVEHNGTSNAAIEGFDRKPFATLGGVAGVVVSTSAEGCANEGSVTVRCSAAGKIGARHYVGGVIGTVEKESSMIGCTNKGVVKVDFTNDGTGKQVWVGGIAGGRNADYKEVDGCKEIKNCVNEGDVYLTSDYKGANNYLAGIAGQALIEAPGDLTGKNAEIGLMSNCTNKGKLTSSGGAQIRVGGLSGGAATIDNSSNEGEIVIGHSGKGAVGGLVGYPTQTKHTVTNSSNTGNITVLDAANVAFGVGGLFGQGGNTVQNYEGCSVNCTISAPDNVWAGIILGTANTLSKTIVYGTAANPFKVKGTVRGTTLTASNYNDYLVGDGGKVASGGKIDTSNVVFWE